MHFPSFLLPLLAIPAVSAGEPQAEFRRHRRPVTLPIPCKHNETLHWHQNGTIHWHQNGTVHWHPNSTFPHHNGTHNSTLPRYPHFRCGNGTLPNETETRRPGRKER
ncbi:hypothetical protein B0T16DRAFT_409779 [Cercophora newfieldiana]|uniref:Uncharacterized protein n=1 Tax=Cercophora newfieldiana TaxID=92897 RepID=A0AA39YAZ2_9PEZI|nr:hypothetical protein B0T16DRAFT_409779 [Cercophora newfieldiana]